MARPTVYVETNFVLEICFRRPEAEAATEILGLAERKLVDLAIPAFCLVEARGPVQAELKRADRLTDELDAFSAQADRFRQSGLPSAPLTYAARLLETLESVEWPAFANALTGVLSAARLIPLDHGSIRGSHIFASALGLDRWDAAVFACVWDEAVHRRPDGLLVFVSSDNRFVNAARGDLERQGIRSFSSIADALGYLRHLLADDEESN
jgi:hypothetical protein